MLDVIDATPPEELKRHIASLTRDDVLEMLACVIVAGAPGRTREELFEALDVLMALKP